MLNVVRGVLVGCLAVAAAFAVGVGHASAQSYFFDYTGSGGVGNVDTISFVATISGLNCNPSCTLNNSSQLTGTMTVTSTGSAVPSGAYTMTFDPANTAFGADQIFSVNTGVTGGGINFEASIPGNGATTFNVSGASNGSGGSEPGVAIVWDPNSDFDTSGTLTYGPEASPAPVVGGGAWSWLALGVVGLAFRRKAVSTWVRSSFAKLTPGEA